jgi:hypothetical protein
MLPLRIQRTGDHVSIKAIVQEIRNEIAKLNHVLHLLGGTKQTKAKQAKPRRKMSAAGRKRIAAAQRARWAKIGAAKK